MGGWVGCTPRSPRPDGEMQPLPGNWVPKEERAPASGSPYLLRINGFMHEGDSRVLAESHVGHRVWNAGHPGLKSGRNAPTWWLARNHSRVPFHIQSVIQRSLSHWSCGSSRCF